MSGADGNTRSSATVYGATRYGRRRALVLTIAVHVALASVLLLEWRHAQPVPRQLSVPTITVLPLATPSEPISSPDKPVPPAQSEKPRETEARMPPPVARIPIAQPLAPITAAQPSIPAAVVPPPSDRAATKPPVARPPPPSSSAPDSWEGRLLAKLETMRRYPAAARSMHQQGIVYLRFRMDRAGHLLSSTIARSSGFALLDRAAVDTLRRAAPLPSIPDDRPDEMELTVPVEFYIN